MNQEEKPLDVISPFCLKCKKPMKFNVPRLGPNGGYVHVDTGMFTCGEREEIKINNYYELEQQFMAEWENHFGRK